MNPEEFSEDPPVDPTVDPDLAPPEPREDRRIVGELIEVEEEDEGPTRLELTHQEREDFSKLLNVGRRTKTINVADHNVVIRTLKTGDEMRVGLYTKPYLDTQGFSRAYQIGVCAAGVVEIVGQDLWLSLKEVTDKDEIFAKNATALAEFYPVVISKIYTEIMNLEREFAELAIKLGKLGSDPLKK